MDRFLPSEDVINFIALDLDLHVGEKYALVLFHDDNTIEAVSRENVKKKGILKFGDKSSVLWNQETYSATVLLISDQKMKLSTAADKLVRLYQSKSFPTTEKSKPKRKKDTGQNDGAKENTEQPSEKKKKQVENLKNIIDANKKSAEEFLLDLDTQLTEPLKETQVVTTQPLQNEIAKLPPATTLNRQIFGELQNMPHQMKPNHQSFAQGSPFLDHESDVESLKSTLQTSSLLCSSVDVLNNALYGSMDYIEKDPLMYRCDTSTPLECNKCMVLQNEKDNLLRKIRQIKELLNEETFGVLMSPMGELNSFKPEVNMVELVKGRGLLINNADLTSIQIQVQSTKDPNLLMCLLLDHFFTLEVLANSTATVKGNLERALDQKILAVVKTYVSKYALTLKMPKTEAQLNKVVGNKITSARRKLGLIKKGAQNN